LARDFEIDMTYILENKTNLFEQLFQFKSSEGIKEWFQEICTKLSCHIALKRQNVTQMLLQKAKDYIAINYSDNELSIQKLADHLHISASYLSMIFKKEANETFLKYLVSIRINAAKDLLFNSDLKTMEIAEKVGYPDVNYFSYFFKKHFGMSPREYKNKVVLKRELQN
jgi:two-component system, response regulator YesN